MTRDVKLFLEDILDSISNVEKFMLNVTKEVFLKKREKQSAVIREIEIIGEAAKNVPMNFRNVYSNIPWKDIAGMRDIITHGYFKVDLETVWKVIKKDLPELKKNILEIKKEL